MAVMLLVWAPEAETIRRSEVEMYRRFTDALMGLTGRWRPAAASAAAPEPALSTAAGPVPSTAARRQVLLLDDEEAILLPTAKYLRGLGWNVDVARESEEGEALISHRHYDLAILDVRVTRFGGTGGLELLREIRRRDHRTSVIVLSAYLSSEMEAEARGLGAAAVLRKPQSLPALAHLALTIMEERRG
jgi:CheY-like chemotaxis protein